MKTATHSCPLRLLFLGKSKHHFTWKKSSALWYIELHTIGVSKSVIHQSHVGRYRLTASSRGNMFTIALCNFLCYR